MKKRERQNVFKYLQFYKTKRFLNLKGLLRDSFEVQIVLHEGHKDVR